MISFQHQGDNVCGNIWSSSLSFINFAAKSSWHFKMRRSCFFILLKRICMCVLTYSMSFYSSFHILPLSIFIYSPLCICSRSAWHNSGSYLVLYSPPFLLKPHCGSSVCPVSSPFAEICFNFLIFEMYSDLRIMLEVVDMEVDKVADLVKLKLSKKWKGAMAHDILSVANPRMAMLFVNQWNHQNIYVRWAFLSLSCLVNIAKIAKLP